jgi:hypothetical protein
MPDAAREWVQVLLRMLLKYRTLVRPGQLAAELVDLSKSIRRLQALLQDPQQARFIVVTRAAEVPRLETERLVARPPALAVGGARRHSQRADPGARPVSPLPRDCPGRAASVGAARAPMPPEVASAPIILTPLAAPPPRGVKAPDRWARTWVKQ